MWVDNIFDIHIWNPTLTSPIRKAYSVVSGQLETMAGFDSPALTLTIDQDHIPGECPSQCNGTFLGGSFYQRRALLLTTPLQLFKLLNHPLDAFLPPPENHHGTKTA